MTGRPPCARWSRPLGPSGLTPLLADEAPIGSGCIAQVYRATMRGVEGSSEREVAVKVLHPGVRAEIELDLAILRLAARILALAPGAALLDPVGIAEEFSMAMRTQLDLRQEASNLDELARNFADVQTVRFPRPVWPWVSRQALVEDLIKGKPVLNFTQSPERKLLARAGLEAVLKMIFVDNLVHADLHPGNILAVTHSGGDEATPPSLAFLDAGIVKRISPRTFRTVVGVLGAMVHYDGRLAGELIIEHARIPHSGEDTAAFCNGIDAVVQHARRPDVSFFDHIGDYVQTILGLAWRYHVHLEPDFVAVALAVRVVEGVAHQLDPDLQVAPLCRPWYYQSVVRHSLAGLPIFDADHPSTTSAPAERTKAR